MSRLMLTAVVTIVITARAAAAQTDMPAQSPTPPVTLVQPPSLTTVGLAPIGHRQPKTTDVPVEKPSDLERLSDEDIKVDRRLTICRGC